jgi:hypothetical protein
MSGAVSSELSEYEKQRLANIARNEAALAALGIGQAKRDMAAAERERAQARIGGSRSKRSIAYGPARASSRIAGKPGPTYADVAEAEAQSSSAWVGRRNTGRRDFYATGFNNTVWPTQEQVAKAAAAAEETVAASQVPASVKVMLPSHVSSGYWLQMPVDLADYLPGSMGKHRFRLLDSTGAEPASGGGPGFPVIWLRRGGNGGGLSGGWRGYAIDRELGVGDVVAFEKLDGNKLRATIHRALTLEERHALAMSHSGGAGNPLAEPKKALSAFMIYSAEVRPGLMKQNGDLATTQKKIGELWRQMPDSEKQPYHEKAQLDRKRYLKERLEHDKAQDSAGEESEDEAAQEDAEGVYKGPETMTPNLRETRTARKRATKQPSSTAAKRSKTRVQIQEQEQKEEYEVERVVGKKKGFYKIHWMGYPSSHDTWEPSDVIEAGAPEAVAAWEAASEAKVLGIKKNDRVNVKFGAVMYAGTVTRVHKKATKARAGNQPNFDVHFDEDDETWTIEPGLHVFERLR